jgi:hypothetical protein
MKILVASRFLTRKMILFAVLNFVLSIPCGLFFRSSSFILTIRSMFGFNALGTLSPDGPTSIFSTLLSSDTGKLVTSGPFPKKFEIREKWLKALKLTENDLKASSRVCSFHFFGGERKKNYGVVASS